MNFRLFEPFREWVRKTRRRKGSKRPSEVAALEGARVGRGGGIHRSPASGEIILRLADLPHGTIRGHRLHFKLAYMPWKEVGSMD